MEKEIYYMMLFTRYYFFFFFMTVYLIDNLNRIAFVKWMYNKIY